MKEILTISTKFDLCRKTGEEVNRIGGLSRQVITFSAGLTVYWKINYSTGLYTLYIGKNL